MNVLLAGPGTGKTTNIKKIIETHGNGARFLILSFTNATVNDLLVNLKDFSVTTKNCMTLHKFTLLFNPDNSRHILLPSEEKILKTISKSQHVGIQLNNLYRFLNCTTFNEIILRFIRANSKRLMSCVRLLSVPGFLAEGLLDLPF